MINIIKGQSVFVRKVKSVYNTSREFFELPLIYKDKLLTNQSLSKTIESDRSPSTRKAIIILDKH
jgi:hypothetical protein